jgi:hypothetical protein
MARPPVGPGRAVDLLVLSEHHAESERGVGPWEARRNRLLGAAAQAVEGARQPAAPPPGHPDAVDPQLARDTTAAEVRGEIEARVRVSLRALQPAGQRQLGADRGPAWQPSPGTAPASAGEPEQHTSAGERATRDARLGRSAERGEARLREEMGAGGDGAAVTDRTGGVVECA